MGKRGKSLMIHRACIRARKSKGVEAGSLKGKRKEGSANVRWVEREEFKRRGTQTVVVLANFHGFEVKRALLEFLITDKSMNYWEEAVVSRVSIVPLSLSRRERERRKG